MAGAECVTEGRRQSLLEPPKPRLVLNAAPVALPDPLYETPQHTPLTVTSQGTTLLDNDWDPEGSTITATLVDNPTHGSISGFGSDSTFTYTLTDKYGNKLHFDSSGKITSRVDANNNSTSYTWIRQATPGTATTS